MIRLRLFGTIDLRSEDARELRSIVLQPKRLALLAYLAVAPAGYHRRDTLVGLFWPEMDAEHARGALSKALHYLRRSLGYEVLDTRGDEELRVDDARLWCDVAAFERALAAGRHAEALDLYRGDLLRGFFLSDAPEFERWLESERERLRRSAASAGWALADEAESGGDLTAAIEWGRRAQQLAGDDEAGLRRLIDLLDRAGDRPGALRAYEEFARRLARDFELEPAEETRALVERIREGHSGPAGLPENVDADGLESADDARVLHSPIGSAGPHGEIPARPAGRRLSPRILVAGAVVVLALLGISYMVAPRSAAPELHPQRVVVAPLENRTGDPSLDPVGAMAADWIIQGLAETGRVQVVPFAASLSSARYAEAIVRATDSTERVRTLAHETGAGIVVTGSYYVQNDSIYLHARITDAMAGDVLEALQPVSASAGMPLTAVEVLRQKVMAALAPHADPRAREAARVVGRTPSYEAYREYAEGMERYVAQRDWRGALVHFARAGEHDPDFTLPLVRSAVIYQQTNDPAAADSVARLLEPHLDRLAEFDREVITAVAGWARGDHGASHRATARAAQLAPNTMPHYQLANVLITVNRPREAVRVLEEIDPHRGELRGWFLYWIRLTYAHHLLGDYREELAVARRAREHFPEHDGGAFRLELRALIALGRVSEALRRLDEHTTTPDYPQRWDLLRHTALELHAHGHPVQARRLFEMSLASHPRRSGPLTRGLGEAYYRAGRLDEAERILRQVASSRPDDLHVAGLLGVIAARRGDREAADAISAALAALDQPYLLGDNTYWRARIAALLGDREHAVELLRAASDEGRRRWMELHHEPDLESLREYPPFRELIRPKG